MDPIVIGVTVGLIVAAILFLVSYLVNFLRKCRKIANLTDKLRNSYKREGSDFCVEQWHGLYGAWKILYWRRCSCCSGCSLCCSNENREDQVQKHTPNSPNSSIAGPSFQRDEDVNDDGKNEGDRLIQCDKKRNNLLDKVQFEKMCKKYEQYDLNRCNISPGCPENKCRHDPVIFLFILDWTKFIAYGKCNSTEDWWRHMFNVALLYGCGLPISTNNSIFNLLDEKKFSIVILQNFPKNWKDTAMELSEEDKKAENFLKYIKRFVESGLYYEYK